jgi:hypothetical protein
MFEMIILPYLFKEHRTKSFSLSQSMADAGQVRPNGLAFSRRERAAPDYVKIATILRAKRSDCNAVLGRKEQAS